MIYSIAANRPPAPRLQKALLHFVRCSSVSNSEFSDLLFPDWFLPVIKAGPEGKGLRANFQSVYEQIRELSPNKRRQFLDHFDNHNSIQELCENPSFKFRKLAIFPQTLKDAFYKLTGHLYDNTLRDGKTCGKIFGYDKACIPWHYERFRKRFIVCPFCGLMDYPTRSAQYDHYLYREEYPLSAANGRNLTPICERCNAAGVKGTTNVLFKSNGTRRPSFYPYGHTSGVTVECACKEPDRITRNPEWSVKIMPNAPQLESKKVESWVEIFRIKDRYSEFLKTDGWKWLESELFNWMKSSTFGGTVSLRRHLKEQAAFHKKNIAKIEKAIIKHPFFEYWSTVPKSVLNGVITNSQTDFGAAVLQRGVKTFRFN